MFEEIVNKTNTFYEEVIKKMISTLGIETDVYQKCMSSMMEQGYVLHQKGKYGNPLFRAFWIERNMEYVAGYTVDFDIKSLNLLATPHTTKGSFELATV